MCENEPGNTKESGEKRDSQHHTVEEDSGQSKDLKKRSYYYDDSCGYEIYQPDENEEEENSQ